MKQHPTKGQRVSNRPAVRSLVVLPFACTRLPLLGCNEAISIAMFDAEDS